MKAELNTNKGLVHAMRSNGPITQVKNGCVASKKSGSSRERLGEFVGVCGRVIEPKNR